MKQSSSYSFGFEFSTSFEKKWSKRAKVPNQRSLKWSILPKGPKKSSKSGLKEENHLKKVPYSRLKKWLKRVKLPKKSSFFTYFQLSQSNLHVLDKLSFCRPRPYLKLIKNSCGQRDLSCCTSPELAAGNVVRVANSFFFHFSLLKK